MTDAGADDAVRATGFVATAAEWDVAKLGSWLRTGLDCWFHPSASRGLRSIAFRPLLVDPDRDPVPLLLDALQMVPGGLERLRDAVSEALATWTGESDHSGDVLDALLRLAKRQPAAAHVPALRRLLCEGHLEGQPRRRLLRLRALEAAVKLIALSEGESLLRDLRRPEHWDPSFAATWLEAMALGAKVHWLDGFIDLRPDLQRTDASGRKLQPVLRRIARRKGDAEGILERIMAFDTLDPWMQEALFRGARAPLPVVERPDWANKGMRVFTLVIAREEAPIYREDYENLDRVDALYSLASGDDAEAVAAAWQSASRPAAFPSQILRELAALSEDWSRSSHVRN